MFDWRGGGAPWGLGGVGYRVKKGPAKGGGGGGGGRAPWGLVGFGYIVKKGPAK